MKRAERRRQKGLMKKWAAKIAHKIYGFSVNDSILDRFVQNCDNLKMCSCEMCRNPRRCGWSKNKGKTKKEIICDLDFKKDLE